MRADLFLEGVHTARVRVVHRVDHHIGDVREGVGAPHRGRRARAEQGQRAFPVLQFRHRYLGAAAPQHDRSVPLASDQQEADARVVGEGTEQRGVAAVELFAGRASVDVGEGDQAEVAGGQHNRVRRRPGVLRRALVDGAVQGDAYRVTRLRGTPRMLRPARHGQPAARPHQVLERQPVRPRKGLPRALSVVGEQHDPVGARGVFGDLDDQGERTVQPCQDLLRVSAVRPGVVRDFVVRDQVGVDGGAPGEHVADDRGDHHIAFDDGREGADEGVEPAALDPRRVLPEPCPGRLDDLPDDLGDERQRGTHGVGRVGEVGEVTGP